MSRIFVTGDKHGKHYDLDEPYFCENDKLTKKDFVIIAGDFGSCWFGETDIEKTNPNYVIPPRIRTIRNLGLRELDDVALDWYASRNYTVLFIDGNHENHKLLATYPVVQWNGGRVRKLRESVLHLMRGQVYNIGGTTIFTMGGASSIDKMNRIPDVSWWKEEMPSDAEYNEAIWNLNKHDWKVDYVITHCCSDRYLYKLCSHHSKPDELTNFFEKLEDKLEFKKWYFGHHHKDMLIDEKHHVLYHSVVEIEDWVERRFTDARYECL